MKLYRKLFFLLLPYAGNYACLDKSNLFDRICFRLIMVLPLPKGEESL